MSLLCFFRILHVVYYFQLHQHKNYTFCNVPRFGNWPCNRVEIRTRVNEFRRSCSISRLHTFFSFIPVWFQETDIASVWTKYRKRPNNISSRRTRSCKIANKIFSKDLWQLFIHYKNTVFITDHCVKYVLFRLYDVSAFRHSPVFKWLVFITPTEFYKFNSIISDDSAAVSPLAQYSKDAGWDDTRCQ
jgi:hypothetical protein